MDQQQVLEMLVELCEDEIIVENPDIDLFEEGLLDSFGTINLLVEIENRFNI